jgi:hypothetical protein
MRIFKLLIFFNLVFIPVLLLSFFGAAYIVRGQLQESAEQQVLENSRVMMQTARASRLYTTKQISPLLDHEQSRVDKANNSVFQILDMQLPAAVQKAIDSIPQPKDKQVVESIRQQILDNVRQASRELPGPEFFPQSIPFYGSTENFNYFRGRYPNYSYKEAALNPTNPRDRTVDWEADVVNIFRNDPARTEVTGHRDTPDGASLYFCAPIRVDDASCLTCHSTPETAPVEMVKFYGTANGFGWKLNEVIGAQIVSVPAELADASAERALRAILLWLGGILGFVLVAANIIALSFFGRLAALVGDAGSAAPVPEGDAAGAGQEAPPQAAPADAVKNRPLRGNRAPRRALVLGLVVLVGLGGYALHRANRRPRLPAPGPSSPASPAPAAAGAATAPWDTPRTPAPGPSSPVSPAPATAGAATAPWDTVPPTASGTPQPAPSPGEADWAPAEQPAPLTLQALPPAPPGPAAPAPSAALATLDSTLPPAAPSPTPSPAETPVETTPVPGEGNDATPRAVVLPAPPAGNPQALNNAAVLERDGGAVTADNVQEGGGERLQRGPGAGRAHDNPSGALTPTTLRAGARWRHVDRPVPPARPPFWQWLFGQKETKKANPAKPRH